MSTEQNRTAQLAREAALKKITPSVARQILQTANEFFSTTDYVIKGTELSFHEGAGMIPNAQTTADTISRFGSHTHAIGKGRIQLPQGISWDDIKKSGLMGMDEQNLRLDLLRDIAEGQTVGK